MQQTSVIHYVYWISYRRQLIANDIFSASSLNENNICHNNNKLDATWIDLSWYNDGAVASTLGTGEKESAEGGIRER